MFEDGASVAVRADGQSDVGHCLQGANVGGVAPERDHDDPITRDRADWRDAVQVHLPHTPESMPSTLSVTRSGRTLVINTVELAF